MSLQTYTFKVVIGGAGGVGKTTLLNKYLHGLFKQDTKLTIGVSFCTKEVTRPDAKINLALWDLGGQDRFRFMQKSYCLGARAAIVFFDMIQLGTMQQVEDWIAMFREHVSPQIPIVLVGGKADLVDQNMLESINEYAQKFVDAHNLLSYFPTSSKMGMNIDELFNYIVDILLGQVQKKAMASVCMPTLNALG